VLEKTVVTGTEAIAPLCPEPYNKAMAKERWRQRVLIVDDDRVVAGMLGELVKSSGYLSVVCNDPRGALALFARNPAKFDAAIVDEIMPALRGTELAGQLLQIKKQIPIILLTGHGGLVTMDQIRKSGVRATLIKPVFRGQLLSILDKLLKHRKQAS
jgi:two-component system, cell cycle sensor histidine kinase and response regulator CckA